MKKKLDLLQDSSLNLFVKAAMSKKALDLVVLDLRNISSVADFFIICSGNSSRQVTAISDYIKVDLKKHDIKPLSVEGKREGHWVLMDYGHVVIHIFHEPVRNLYDLEGFWSDADKITP